MQRANRDPWLLTPGPLTTSATVKQAMLRDWGSRDQAFIQMNAEVRARLVDLAGASATHTCVTVQGSGTFAVESTLGTMIPADGRALVLVNGAYGERIVTILQRMGRDYEVVKTTEDRAIDVSAVESALEHHKISHVVAVHCETTSGVLNPVAAIAGVAAYKGAALIIDAMSGFGALPLDAREVPFDALIASSNKCLEGAPGVGFAIIRESSLRAAQGNAPGLSLDLHAQWEAMEKNGQWRFTPPTHVVAALHQALVEHADEGGCEGRLQRYQRNCDVLIDGMRALGFETLLSDDIQAPIIITFHMPSDPSFEFTEFYNRLADLGFVIYPGKLTVAESFRIGCIGQLYEPDMRNALAAIKYTLETMAVERCGRAA